MPAARRSLRRTALALVLTVGILFGAVVIADAPASAAESAPTVTDISVAPYEASNPLVPSAALPYLAVTLTVERELPNTGDTFEVRAPAGTRAVLSEGASIVDAAGAALVDVAVTAQSADGDTVTGTFTETAANSRKVSGTFTFFLQIVGNGILSEGGGTYHAVFDAEGVRHTADVGYGVAVDLFRYVGGHWVHGATSTSTGRFVVQAKAEGDSSLAARGGQWVAAGADPSPPFTGSTPDCAGVQLREFSADPGPVNIPVSGGTVLVAGTDYVLNCDDSLDGTPVVSATIPRPVDGAFYVLSSPREVTGVVTYLPADNPAVPEAGRAVGLFNAIGAVSDALHDPSGSTQTSTLLMYTGRSGGIGSTEPASPGLDLDTAASPAEGTSLRPGDRVAYEFTLTNTGNVPLADATLTADLASLLRAARIDRPIGATAGAAVLDGDVLRWTGLIAPGDSVTVSFSALVVTGGTAIVVDVEATSPGARGGSVPVDHQTLTREVVAAPAAAVDQGDPTLPRELARSGGDGPALAAAGIAFAFAGAWLSVAARRRQSR
ncbi:hypothetical protein [Microbacterium sp. NPDC091662]|uniref:DUF7927 domain-containing protein n=1 Tax=Microbacterium sp. NPDC091662 TaxID=3364211 RepID=UPI00382CFB98